VKKETKIKEKSTDMRSDLKAERQNVTLSLPKELIKKSKVMAAQKDMSLSAFLRAALENKVREETGYESARERQAGLLEKGFHFGTKGQVGFNRDDLHARRKK
jgi:hypothetical protein